MQPYLNTPDPSPSGLIENCIVCVLEQGWNKTLQGCGSSGTEFDTPALKDKKNCTVNSRLNR